MSYIRISSVDSNDSGSSSATVKGSVGQIGPLSNIRFAVFALGSSAYPNFCAFGRFVDNMLADLGGERIMKLATGDELCGQEQAFTEWSQKVFQEAGEVFCFGDEVNLSEVLQTASLKRGTWSQDDVRLVPSTASKMNINKALCGGSNRKMFKMSLNCVDLLYDYSADTRKTIKVTLHLVDTNPNFTYLPGDHLGIFAENGEDHVNAIIERLPGLNVDQLYCVQLRQVRQVGLKEIEDWITHERFACISIREALKRCIDIMSPPTQQMLALLAEMAQMESEKEEIKTLATDGKKYENWKGFYLPSFLDVLMMFPSLSPSGEFILTQMPPLQPRYYSISSSPLFNGTMLTCNDSNRLKSGKFDKIREQSEQLQQQFDYSYSLIELTVAVVTFRTPSGSDRAGVCSQFLYKTGTSDPGHSVYGFIRSAPNFRMPDKDDVPIIMVGPGTGIAPFRSFWLQRFANQKLHPQKKFGPMSLFFGCRTPQVQLYKDEVEQMNEKGVLTHVAIAYSRHPSQPKVSCSQLYSPIFIFIFQLQLPLFSLSLLNLNSTDTFLHQIIHRHEHMAQGT